MLPLSEIRMLTRSKLIIIQETFQTHIIIRAIQNEFKNSIIKRYQ